LYGAAAELGNTDVQAGTAPVNAYRALNNLRGVVRRRLEVVIGT
jgi:hypothetical protein